MSFLTFAVYMNNKHFYAFSVKDIESPIVSRTLAICLNSKFDFYYRVATNSEYGPNTEYIRF